MGVESLINQKRIKPITTQNARSLRRNLTLPETKLWQAIRDRQISDVRIRRQHPIGKYIADFAAHDKKLVIELDGGQHQDQTDYDQARTMYLQSQGWRVLRFWNNDVLDNLDGVMATVIQTIASQSQRNCHSTTLTTTAS